MIRQYIEVGDRAWGIILYYNAGREDLNELKESLMALNCPMEDIEDSLGVIYRRKNTGFTFSNSDFKMSIVCISKATSASLFVHTAVHEAKHVQSHICAFYDIDENSEDAAYLIGHIVQKMYAMVAKIIRKYVRFIGK